MSGLTAIDVVIDPDDAAAERAREVNARVLKSMPGWELDDTHPPRITTLQRYVRTADLEAVCDAIEETIAATDIAGLSYEAVAITHEDWGFPGYAPTVLLVQVDDDVLDFQADLADAVAPFVGAGGTAAAFVTAPGEKIDPTIIARVEAYVPDQIGEGQYRAHLVAGLAMFDDLEVIEAEPFDAFDVHPVSVSVHHLGNSGTAGKLLKAWPIKP